MVDKRLNFCFVKHGCLEGNWQILQKDVQFLQSEKFFSSRVDELVKAMYIPSDSKQIEEK